MTHDRKAVRDAVVAALNGETAAGTEVHSGKLHPLTTLPALIVWTKEDAFAEFAAVEDSSKARDVVLVIEAHVAGLMDTIDDSLDALAEQVEASIEADLTLGAVATTAEYVGTVCEFDGGVNPPTGLATITYAVRVYP